jgi:hypothetical protein
MMNRSLGTETKCLQRINHQPFDDEDQRRAYWECVEEDRPEQLEEDLDKPMTANVLQWVMEEF